MCHLMKQYEFVRASSSYLGGDARSLQSQAAIVEQALHISGSREETVIAGCIRKNLT